MSSEEAIMNSQLQEMVNQADEPYKRCEIHEVDMMEKNISCLTCQTLVCALCLRDFHLSHEIMSVIRLRELKKLGRTLEMDVNALQSCQLRLQNQISERERLLKNIEASKNTLIVNIEKAFQQLQDILKSKKEEVLGYINEYYNKHHSTIKNDLEVLGDRYTLASNMIKNVLQFFNQLHIMLKESPDIPRDLNKMVETMTVLPTVENKDQMMVDKKFDKILPSLQAIANICQSLHPEATKICLSRVNSPKIDILPPEILVDSCDTATSDASTESTLTPIQTVRVSARSLAKKSNTSSHNSSESTSRNIIKQNSNKFTDADSGQPRKTILESDCAKCLPVKDKSVEKETSLNSRSSFTSSELLKRKQSEDSTVLAKKSKLSVIGVINNKDKLHNRNTEEKTQTQQEKAINPDTNKMEFNIVKFDPLQLEAGNAAIVFSSNRDLQIGKVINTSRVKFINSFEILWYKGEVGKDRLFTLKGRDKLYGHGKSVCVLETSMVETSNLICFFKYDFKNTVPHDLNSEINKAIRFKNGGIL